MKKKFLFGTSLFLAGFLAAFIARASTTLIGSLVTLNGTTNSTSVSFGSFFPNQPTVFISNGGLASTNALTGNLQISLDNANFTTIATYNPSITNAQTDTWRPALTNPTVYLRLQLVSTNSIQVGAILQ